MALSLPDTIRVAIAAVLPNRPPITHIQPITRPGGRHPGVYRVALQDATCLIAKYQPFAPFTRGKPHDLLEVEQYTCTLLANAPIPRIYGISPAHNLIFLEDCGNTTLDDFCQESDPQTHTTFATAIVDGFTTLQNAFLTHALTLTPHTFPGCTPNDLQKSWVKATSHLPKHLPHLLHTLNIPTTPTTHASQTLSKLLTTLSANEPLLGPTDYNARNIVVDPHAHSFRFIELSKLGWDWPERRLVQYTASSGAGRPTGTFLSLLNPSLTARWPSPETLDAHHFIYHLLATRTLTTALSTPSSPLLTAWQNPQSRLKTLRTLLSTPLSNHPQTTQLRTLFTQ